MKMDYMLTVHIVAKWAPAVFILHNTKRFRDRERGRYQATATVP